MSHPLLPDLPSDRRCRHLILLSKEDYESIPKNLLHDYLAPLFPATRPSNDKKIERALAKKSTPAKTIPPKKHIAEQFNLQLAQLAEMQQLLKNNAKLKKS
jgi:hypothetical protein